jgi:uncharacterized protein YndB with AHSA1/START domain
MASEARSNEPRGHRGAKADDLVMTREFDASRKLVYDAWAKPENLQQWFGPAGFTMPNFTMEFRVGGRFEFNYRGPDGTEYPGFVGKFVEIAELERIAFAGYLGAPENKVRTVVTFEEAGGKTKLTVHQSFEFESPATQGAPEGWRQTLARLSEFLARS